MELLWALAAVILVVVYIFDREVLQFDAKAFKWFLKTLFIGSILSIVVNILVERIPHLSPVPVSSLLMVWQEDILFSCLLLYYVPKILPKDFETPLMIMTTFIFGYLHLYQGLLAATLLSVYPLISLRLGKKYGWGTVCVGHVVYDLAIYFNCWVLNAI